MKKLLLLSACIAFFAASCTKKAAVIPNTGASTDTLTEKDTISATIDQVSESFNSTDTVRSSGTSGIYISGTNAANSDRIVIMLGELTQSGIGTYSSADTTNNVQMLYGQGPGYTPENYFFTYHPALGTPFDCSVTITEFTYTRIKGTFKGNLVQKSSVTGTGTQLPKSVTNGKFSLSLR